MNKVNFFRRQWALLLVLGPVLTACQKAVPPEPFGPTPSPRQLAWQHLEMYAFVHFNMNTFTNMEWGLGDESPATFNPTQLDCRQWARVCKESGLKGIIITAKHHDGFCLWPSKFTEHSVKNSPWKNGQGDVIRELSEACAEYGLKMGIYLSPWDRNHPDYGRPEYVSYFQNQLRELLTNYGEIFEVWFDGANGGSGYYGGANETRKIDAKTYYQWDSTVELVRQLQPNAVIFGDGGPDIRWVGNEEGWANPTNWSLLRKDEVYPGWPKYVQLRSGHEDGTHWIPAECDVSIRPGWYYHPYEDHKVKSVSTLVDIYYNSVGRNGSLLLNFPVDNRGLIHENDVRRLEEFTNIIRQDLMTDLAVGSKVASTSTRRNDPQFDPDKLTDGNTRTYWTTDDEVTSASLTLDLGEPTAFNRLLLQEHIPLGQRVESFGVEALVDGEWKTIAQETTIGYKRILRLPDVTAAEIRINITRSKACPTLANLEIYKAPPLLVEPRISRNKEGLVSVSASGSNLAIYYSLNGDEPTQSSIRYERPFAFPQPGEIKAVVVDLHSGNQSRVSSLRFDISKQQWKVAGKWSSDSTAIGIIDDDPGTWWETGDQHPLPNEVTVDLGKTHTLTGFTYLPMQERWIRGVVTTFEFLTSQNGKNWVVSAEGEFDNIIHNPITQTREFAGPRECRFIRFRGLATAYGSMSSPNKGNLTMAIAELGVITQPNLP